MTEKGPDYTVHSIERALAILDGGEVVIVERDRSPEVVTINLGLRAQVHCTAEGKVLLAYLPREEIICILETQGMPQRAGGAADRLDGNEPQLLRNLRRFAPGGRCPGLYHQVAKTHPGRKTGHLTPVLPEKAPFPTGKLLKRPSRPTFPPPRIFPRGAFLFYSLYLAYVYV